MKMLNAILQSDDDGPNRFIPLYLSDHALDPALFIAYTVLIGVTMITCIIFPVMLIVNASIFSFSYTIILVQIIVCGFWKILVRTLCYFGITFPNLYSIELTFDFGVLLFITSMTINRLLVISTPKDCFIYANKSLQVFFVMLIWVILAIILASFRLGNCVRFIQEDKRMSDTCFELFSYNKFSRAQFGIWLDPIIIIRKIVMSAYDILPLFCLAVYILSALVLMYKRRLIRVQSHHRIELRIFFHGFVIFVVYGTASIINMVLEHNREAILEGAIAQFVLFIYVILDVTTILCIPLCIFFTVPAVRTSPRTSFVDTAVQSISDTQLKRARNKDRPVLNNE